MGKLGIKGVIRKSLSTQQLHQSTRRVGKHKKHNQFINVGLNLFNMKVFWGRFYNETTIGKKARGYTMKHKSVGLFSELVLSYL